MTLFFISSYLLLPLITTIMENKNEAAKKIFILYSVDMMPDEGFNLVPTGGVFSSGAPPIMGFWLGWCDESRSSLLFCLRCCVITVFVCATGVSWTRVLIWYQLGFFLGDSPAPKWVFGWGGCASSDPNKTVTLSLKIQS